MSVEQEREQEDPFSLRAARTTHARWVKASGAHLLVVDSRPEAASEVLTLRDRLAERGVHVSLVDSGFDCLIAVGRSDPQAVILPPTLPDVAPSLLAHKIAQYSAATLLHADDEVGSDGGAAASSGSNVSVTWPYDAERIWTLLDRSRPGLDERARLRFGPIELDAHAYTVTVDERRIGDLPLKEFELLQTLMSRAPDVLTNGELRQALWGDAENGASDKALSVHASRLRRRLEDVADVRRIRGRGYSLTLL